jgi:iron complex outermembrane receptor protein
MRKLTLIALCVILRCFSANAQQPDTTHVFTLGKVVVTSTKPVSSVVSAQRLEHFARTDVSHALDLLPGVNVSAVGPRNESMVYVRGFDLWTQCHGRCDQPDQPQAGKNF